MLRSLASATLSLVGVTALAAAPGCNAYSDSDDESSYYEETAEAVTWAPECTAPVPGTCGFYVQCLEAKFACGSSGYPVGYGDKYCNEFAQASGLSARGMDWRDATLACLQRSLTGFMSPSVVPENPACETLQAAAFDSHPACYTQPGSSLCDLDPSDVSAIFWTVDTSDKLGYESVVQMAAVAKTCAPVWGTKLATILATLPPSAIAFGSFLRPVAANGEALRLREMMDVFEGDPSVEGIRDGLARIAPAPTEARP